MSRFSYNIVILTALSLAIGCTSCSKLYFAADSPVPPIGPPGPLSTTPIQHIVVIMQENRSFDNLFNGFPGADSVRTGMKKGIEVPLAPIPLGGGSDTDHTHTGWWEQWDGGKMDNFANKGTMRPYSYVKPGDVAPYWTLARNFTLGDRMFQANTGPSFVAHQYMIAGQSEKATEDPSGAVWGCGAADDARVKQLGPNGTDTPGVFPCFDYKTIADLLDAKGITWRYYAPSPREDKFFILSAFQAIRHIFSSTDWHNKVISPETQVLTDIANGKLAQVTWIVPAYNNSDHPGAPDQGPDWVADIVNAIGQSPLWDSTAIFISWDDWGGWYDHVPPPQVDDMGLGFRVPVIVVSPYAKQGYISHVTHESGGFLRFIEKIFDLPSLGTRDSVSDDFSDCFDLNQQPTPYTPVHTNRKPEFFLSQRNSGLPDDD